MKKIVLSISVVCSTLGFAQQTNDAKPKENKIQEVTLTKTKKAVEQKADRTIFDFSEQPSLNSGSLMEGIKKIPGLVSSDMVGITYQGKSLDVYQNGKPLNISSNALDAYLESMPAGSVDRIEIITQPGAEYPATSGGTILNIITNKSAKSYLTAVYNGGYRFSNYDKYRSRFNNSVALNARNKLFSWQVNLGQYYRETLTDAQFDTLTRNISSLLGRTYYLNTAFTFDIGKDRLLLSYDASRSNNAADITANNYLNQQTIASNFNSSTKGVIQEASATYQKKFADKDKKLDFGLVYTGNNSKFGQQSSTAAVLDNSSTFNGYTFKIDYSQPVKILDQGKVSLGTLFDEQDFKTKSFGVTNLDYSRKTSSAYLEFQATKGKFDFILGSRAENYNITGITSSLQNGTLQQNDLTPFKKFKVFPNASVQYNFIQHLFANLNYNKKITLPSVSMLNPNNTTLSTQTISSVGNPNLQPTIYDNAEFKISAFDYAFIGYNTSWVKNQVVQRVSRSNNLIQSQQVQVSSLQSHNFNLGIPIPFMLFTSPFSDILKFNMNPDKMNLLYIYTGYEFYKLSDIKTKGVWAVNLMGQFILPKDVRFQLNYSVITAKGNYYYFETNKPLNNSLDITLSKKFDNDRLSVSLFAKDVFNQNKTVMVSRNINGDVLTSNKTDTRSFGISINYKLPTKNKLAKVDPTVVKSGPQE